MTYFKNSFIFLTIILTFVSLSAFSQFKQATLVKDTISRGDVTFLYNQIKYDTVSVVNRSGYIEKLRHLEVNSGTIYFSGSGFPQVASTTYKGRLGGLAFLYRCVSGSKITFEKCTFINDDSTISKLLNKAIFLK